MTVKSIRPNQKAAASFFVLVACVALAVKACVAQTPAEPAPRSKSVAPSSTAPSAAPPVKSRAAGEQSTATNTRSIVKNASIRDRNGGVVFKGDIDLTESLARIDKGDVLDQFSNDGSVFQNRERRLPEKARGYYREWVHQTPKLSGPGPQRIVTGNAGEAYYTADHYKTFRKIREPAPPPTTTKSTIGTPVRPEKKPPASKL